MDEGVNQFFTQKKLLLRVYLTFYSSICIEYSKKKKEKKIYISIYKEISTLPIFPIRMNACSIISI